MKSLPLILPLLTCLSCPALAAERVLAEFTPQDELRWQTVNDGVMGGRSRGGPTVKDGTLTFEGTISLENKGGFSSIRTRRRALKLSGYQGIALRVRGDGRTYKLALRTGNTGRWIAYWAEFRATKEWREVRLPFSAFVPTSFGRKLPGPKLAVDRIDSVGFMLYDKQAGPFRLEVERIAAYDSSAAAPEPQRTRRPRRMSEEPTPPPAPAAIKKLLARAIELGAPLYNEGNPAACAAVYAVTGEALLAMGALPRDLAGRLKAALAEEGDADARAWALRRVFDAIYARLSGEPEPPQPQGREL